MSPPTDGLPHSIVIPLANPRTAADLVRIGTSGNLPGLLRRDRGPAGRAIPLRTSESKASAGSDAAEPPNAWFGAAGTWSGFTWPTAVPRARHHD